MEKGLNTFGSLCNKVATDNLISFFRLRVRRRFRNSRFNFRNTEEVLYVD